MIFPDYQVGCLCDQYQNSYSKNKSALILLWLSILIICLHILSFWQINDLGHSSVLVLLIWSQVMSSQALLSWPGSPCLCLRIITAQFWPSPPMMSISLQFVHPTTSPSESQVHELPVFVIPSEKVSMSRLSRKSLISASLGSGRIEL